MELFLDDAFVPLPGVSIGVGSLHISHYDRLLLFVLVPLWQDMFVPCAACPVTVHFTNGAPLNPQSINCLSRWIQWATAGDWSPPH